MKLLKFLNELFDKIKDPKAQVEGIQETLEQGNELFTEVIVPLAEEITEGTREIADKHGPWYAVLFIILVPCVIPFIIKSIKALLEKTSPF